MTEEDADTAQSSHQQEMIHVDMDAFTHRSNRAITSRRTVAVGGSSGQQQPAR